MLYKYGKRTHNIFGRFYFSLVRFLYFEGVFCKTIILLELARIEIIIKRTTRTAALIWL